MRKYQILSVILFLFVCLFSFDKYLSHHETHNEWIVIYEGDDYFIEARINLYKLRSTINKSNTSINSVVWDLFAIQLQNHPFPHIPSIPIKNCVLTDMLGNLNGGILIQVRCSK